jgi:hypothetical protein
MILRDKLIDMLISLIKNDLNLNYNSKMNEFGRMESNNSDNYNSKNIENTDIY